MYSASSDSRGRKMVLKAQQMLVEWMMDLMSKFCREGGVVVDTCGGTSKTAKAFLQL